MCILLACILLIVQWTKLWPQWHTIAFISTKNGCCKRVILYLLNEFVTWTLAAPRYLSNCQFQFHSPCCYEHIVAIILQCLWYYNTIYFDHGIVSGVSVIVLLHWIRRGGFHNPQSLLCGKSPLVHIDWLHKCSCFDISHLLVKQGQMLKVGNWTYLIEHFWAPKVVLPLKAIFFSEETSSVVFKSL